jgi:hypothetical protein
MIVLCAMVLITGCAYRYYLGMHGPSVRSHADIHAGFKMDNECLECHASQINPRGPVTSHPQFKGCLKCHDDEFIGKKPSSQQ